jgi:hypothetical protein
MPCYDGRAAADAAQMQNRIDRLTAMLCTACRTLEAHGHKFDGDATLASWWSGHKQWDADRA